jgi:hypothetical protein
MPMKQNYRASDYLEMTTHAVLVPGGNAVLGKAALAMPC